MAGRVQQPDDRPEDVSDQHKRRRGEKRQDPRRPDGQGLGGLLAQRHVQERDQSECRQRNDPHREARDQSARTSSPKKPSSLRVAGASHDTNPTDPGYARHRIECRTDQRLDPVFDGPPQRQARDRDADLGRREVDVQLVQRLAGHPGRPASLLDHLVDLAGPHLHQRELGGDEVGVDEDQPGDDQEV